MPESRLTIRPFRSEDETAVIRLWFRCDLVRPWNNPKRDIERKQAHSPELFLVGELEGEVVATVMAGYEGHRGWINYLAVDPGLRRNGLGREMMEAAEDLLRRAGAPKINLQVRFQNRDVIDFYEAIGYKVDKSTSMGKRLEPDPPYPRPDEG